MESNMSFTTVGFKGEIAPNGVPVFNHDGAPFTVGGYISSDNTEVAYFGRVVSATAAAPRTYLMGIAGVQKVVGILQNDYATQENSPFKANYLLPTLPATAIFFGMCWLSSWTHAGTGTHTTPVRGDVVIFKDTTGQIEFLPVLTAVPSGYTILDASVMEYDADTNGVLLFMGISNAMSEAGTTPEVLENTSFQLLNSGSAIPGIILTGLFTNGVTIGACSGNGVSVVSALTGISLGACTTGISISGIIPSATAGRAVKATSTINNANLGDGYGLIESDLTLTGTVAGHVSALSSWIEAITVTTGGNIIAAQTNGIYSEVGAVLSNSTLIFGMRMQCLCQVNGGVSSTLFYPFSIVNNTNITTALIQCNDASSDLGRITNAGVDSGLLIPLYKDNSGVKYVKIYTHT
jgi:hypothetical protein